MFTDAHCHLDPQRYGGDAAVDAVIARARAAGVTRMVTIGTSPASAERARALARRHRGVWWTVGLHPHQARSWDGPAPLGRLAPLDGCVAIGETGLDFFRDRSPRDQQRTAFRAQIRLALELELPVVVHDRESGGEALDILDQEEAFAGAGVVFHCFSGDRRDMDRLIDRGGYLSIPGIVTYRGATAMREVARVAPLDRVMIETDSPYLSPAPHRRRRNEPARVVRVAETLAELRGLETAEVGRATSRTATEFFRLPAA